MKSGERVRITANGAITGRVRLFVYQRAITRGEKERYPNIAPYSPKVYISATIKVVFAKAGTKTVVLHVLPTVRPRLAHAGQIILGVNVVSIHNHRMQVPIR